MEEELLSKCSPKDKFLFMLQQRIISLEEKVNTLEIENNSLKNILCHGVVTYNLDKNKYFNQAIFNWDIKNHPDTMTLIYRSNANEELMNSLYWNASIVYDPYVVNNHENLCIYLPIQYYSKGIFPIQIECKDLTLRKLIFAIYEFYQKDITQSDIDFLKTIEYNEEVVTFLQDKKIKRWEVFNSDENLREVFEFKRRGYYKDCYHEYDLIFRC